MSGGGTVFLSGDDTFEPVIAYTSADVDYDSLAPASPLRALLERDVRVRRGTSAAASKWRRLLAKGAAASTAGLASVAPLDEPGDIRVPALVKTEWDQLTDKSGNRCYNRMTPENYHCGCIATAMAQIMRLHRWPDADHPVESRNCQCYVDFSGRVETLSGGVYDWDLMPTDATGDRISTAAQRQEIGRLAADAGFSVRMWYTSDAAYAFAFVAANELKSTWRFGPSTYFYDEYRKDDVLTDDETRRMKILSRAVFANLDAGCPVMLGIGIKGTDAGHCVLADGYGYDDGTDYVHLNLGWSGHGDVWYNLPWITCGYDFDAVGELVYNVFPTDSTTCAALSGRVVNSRSEGLADAAVTVCRSGTSTVAARLVSSPSGVYGAVLPAGKYDLVAVSSDLSLTSKVSSVTLQAPGVRSVSFRCQFVDGGAEESVPCGRVVTSPDSIGNSWGNDLVLDETIRKAATNFYVSAASGVDAPDRGTSAAPFATIQYAITNGQPLVAGDVIRVLPGTYRGCVETPETRVSVVSTDGPDVTVIDGEGRDCCYFGVANPTNLIAGFTLTNGAYYGGICVGTATNCVIVNCSSGDARSYGYGGGAYQAVLYGCVLHNNASDYGGGAARSTLVNCTVYDNWASTAGGGVDCQCAVTNSIVWRNWATDDDVEDNWELLSQRTRTGIVYYSPSFAYSCTCPEGFDDLGGNVAEDPLCVSFDVDDWRLRSGSPCVGTASDGSNMGAWQGEPVVGSVITAETRGRGVVTPRSQFVPLGGEATFVAEGDHPFLGYETNGVTASLDRTFVWRDVHEDATVVACFGVTNYCVDASVGDDDNDGLAWETPLKSIFGMVMKAGRGDTAKVKPGVYEGCDWCVYGVEVASTDGPAATVIDGGGTNICAYANEMTYRGFTFRNGSSPSNVGGGGYYGTFVDCVFSNCTAGAGGGAAYAVLTNCLIVGNSAVPFRSGWQWVGGFGSGAYECGLSNCTVFSNDCVDCAVVNSAVTEDPRHFRDAAKGDFRLKPNSDYVDAGDSESVTVARDLAGTNRVWGASVDCGCYEYHLPPGVTDPTGVGIPAALAAEGYRGGFAAAVAEPKDYAYLVEWTLAHGLTAADLSGASTGLLSPALNADGILAVGPGEIVTQAFAPADEGAWKLTVAFPGYDRERIYAPLFRAAVGAVAAPRVEGPYASDDLPLVVTPAETNVVLTLFPSPSVTNLFIKATLR